MNLDVAQRKKVAAWIAEGLKLSEIQKRLADDLGVRLTYMDVRLLVDDLKLTPKDTELPKPPPPPVAAAPAGPHGAAPASPLASTPANAPATGGAVSVSVDQIARPGALVSGGVTFSDGNKANWYLDQTGRLGLAPQQQGYRPSPADVQQFQAALESELARLGFA